MKKTLHLLTIIIFPIFLITSQILAQDWGQIGSDIDGEASSDFSGYSIAMSPDGSRVAIGAIGNDGTASDAGHVRVYSESGGVWTQVGSDIDGEAAGDLFGYSVTLSSNGSRLAVGAIRNDNIGSDAGHVRVYSESGAIWTQVGSDIDGEAASDESGNSVSLSSDGTRVAIGAHYNDANGNMAGHVRIYSESGGVWTQVGSDIDGEASSDFSGYSIAMSPDGSRVAIGAIGNDGTASDAGHVRVYSESGAIWTQVGSDIDGEAAGDESGTSVSLSSDGTRVAIGAPHNEGAGSAVGHVRIYSESGGIWTQVGSDIDGETTFNVSGESVSLSSDGTRVAIGAPLNDGAGGSAGHVRVYSESGAIWTQVGSDIDGEAASDESGNSVSLSSDGTRVAIGAPYNDGNGTDAGHVKIFFEDAALPVELSSFTVEATNQGVLCKWTTESEIENLGFILERKTQGTNWQKIVSYKTDIGLMGQGTIGSPTYYEYLDTFIEPNATYEYRLADVDLNGVVTYHSIRTVTVVIKEFTVLPAYPNPFNPSTTIRYGIDTNSNVSIEIYDIAGQLISTLLNGEQTPGWHSIIWNGTNQHGEQVPAGLYFSRITSGDNVKTTKLMLLK